MNIEGQQHVRPESGQIGRTFNDRLLTGARRIALASLVIAPATIPDSPFVDSLRGDTSPVTASGLALPPPTREIPFPMDIDPAFPAKASIFTINIYTGTSRPRKARCTSSPIRTQMIFTDPLLPTFPLLRYENTTSCQLIRYPGFQPGDLGSREIGGRHFLPIAAETFTVLRTDSFSPLYRYDRVAENRQRSSGRMDRRYIESPPVYELRSAGQIACKKYFPVGLAREQHEERQYWFNQDQTISVVGTARVRSGGRIVTKYVPVGTGTASSHNQTASSGKFILPLGQEVPVSGIRDDMLFRCGSDKRFYVGRDGQGY